MRVLLHGLPDGLPPVLSAASRMDATHALVAGVAPFFAFAERVSAGAAASVADAVVPLAAFSEHQLAVYLVSDALCPAVVAAFGDRFLAA
jgi:L-asparagine transporter-like permease